MEHPDTSEKMNVNVVLARSFINSLQFIAVADSIPVLNIVPGAHQKFSLLVDAQLSVLASLASIITDENEVLAEFDRMTDLIKTRNPESEVVKLVVDRRETLISLLKYSTESAKTTQVL